MIWRGLRGILAILVLLTALAGLGCSIISGGQSTPTALPTPTPPAELVALPRQARIQFIATNPNWDRVALWELPGLEPGDSDRHNSRKGEAIGSVPGCSLVTITNYAWSQTDRDFFLYVEASTALEGWVPLSLVALDPNLPCTAPWKQGNDPPGDTSLSELARLSETIAGSSEDSEASAMIPVRSA